MISISFFSSSLSCTIRSNCMFSSSTSRSAALLVFFMFMPPSNSGLPSLSFSSTHTTTPSLLSAPFTLSHNLSFFPPFFAHESIRICWYLTPHSAEQYFDKAPREGLWQASEEEGSGCLSPRRQRFL